LKDIAKELEMVAVELDVQESIYEQKIEELTAKQNSFLNRKKELEAML